jgi:hypothetical protein
MKRAQSRFNSPKRKTRRLAILYRKNSFGHLGFTERVFGLTRTQKNLHFADQPHARTHVAVCQYQRRTPQISRTRAQTLDER